MEWLKHITEHLPIEPVQVVYGVVAFCGGVARYLNGIANNGVSFNFGIFCASAFVAGFSGYMFGLLGQTMQFPVTMTLIMAGTGGFFGDQTMKLILEYIQTKKL